MRSVIASRRTPCTTLCNIPHVIQPLPSANPASARQACSCSQMIDTTMYVQTNAISSFPSPSLGISRSLSPLAGFPVVPLILAQLGVDI